MHGINWESLAAIVAVVGAIYGGTSRLLRNFKDSISEPLSSQMTMLGRSQLLCLVTILWRSVKFQWGQTRQVNIFCFMLVTLFRAWDLLIQFQMVDLVWRLSLPEIQFKRVK